MTERQRKLAELRAKRAKQGYNDRVNFVLDNDKVFKDIKESISELSEMIGNQKTEANLNTSQVIKALEPLNSLQPELERIAKLSAEIGQKEFPKPLEKVRIKNLDQLIKAVEKEGRLVELVDKKVFADIHKALVNITQRLENQTVRVDIDKDPAEFIPVRRVIKLGNRLVYDDSTNSGGGGGGSGTPTITADSPQLDAVPVVNPDGSNISDVDVVSVSSGKTILSAGGSASSSGNNTLVAAGTNRLKVHAFSLTTTSTTAMTCIFQSGAGGTELWRVIIQAISGSNAGANLAVPVPGWLFATASATLLNLNLSSANAVHWSVSYIDEA